NSRQGNLARAGLCQRVGIQLFPAVRRHDDVHTRVDRRSTAGICATSDLSMTIPVAYDQAVEMQPLFQHVRQEVVIAVHFHALPAGERSPDALYSRAHGRPIACEMNASPLCLTRAIVSLVVSAGATVAHVVLRRRDYMRGIEEFRRTEWPL